MKTDYYLSFVVLFQTIAVSFQLMVPWTGLATVETAAKYRILLTLLLYIPAIYLVFRRKSQLISKTFLLYFLFLLFSYVFYPASHEFVLGTNGLALTPISILSVLSILSVRDFSRFKETLLIVSRCCLLVAIIFLIVHTLTPFRDADDPYSMGFSYGMLLPALYLFSCEKLLDKIISVSLLLIILLVGSRGALVVAGLFYFYDVFFIGSKKRRAKALVFMALILLVGFFIFPHIELLESSRTMSLVNSGEFVTHDGERVDIYERVWNLILSNPFWGCGIGAEGIITHNVILEFWLHYGLIIGTSIMIAFIVWDIRLFRSNYFKHNLKEKEFFVMMFLYGIIPSMVSTSYLELGIAIMLGCMMRQKKYARIWLVARKRPIK